MARAVAGAGGRFVLVESVGRIRGDDGDRAAGEIGSYRVIDQRRPNSATT